MRLSFLESRETNPNHNMFYFLFLCLETNYSRSEVHRSTPSKAPFFMTKLTHLHQISLGIQVTIQLQINFMPLIKLLFGKSFERLFQILLGIVTKYKKVAEILSFTISVIFIFRIILLLQDVLAAMDLMQVALNGAGKESFCQSMS